MEPDSRGDLRKGSPAPITFARPAVYEAREQHERFVPKEMQVREGRVENEIKESLCVVHDNPLGSPRTRVFSGHAATNGLQSGCLRARSQSGERRRLHEARRERGRWRNASFCDIPSLYYVREC